MTLSDTKKYSVQLPWHTIFIDKKFEKNRAQDLSHYASAFQIPPVGLPGCWEVMEATGFIHPQSSFAASAAVNASAAVDGLIYISGGGRYPDFLSSAFSTLSAKGHFNRLQPKGEIPQLIRSHCGFAYEVLWFKNGTKIK